MPRYFFDFRQGLKTTADKDGVEFSDVEHAYLEAYEAALEMWSDLLKKRCDPRRCFFEVRNEGRKLLFTLPFQEALDCCLDREKAPLRNAYDQVTATSHYAARVGSGFADELSRLSQALAQSRALLKQKV